MQHENFKPLLLVFPFNYLSHYLRCLVLARYLKPYFEIIFAYSEQYISFISKEGFKVFPCSSFNAEEVLSNVKDFDFSWLNQQDLEAVFSGQISAIKKYQPAAVLGDAMPTLKMAAEYTGVPYLSLLNGYMTKYYSDVRSISETHPVSGYIKNLPPFLKNKLTVLGESFAFRTIHKPFKKLRSKYGLRPAHTYLDELEGDYNLICDSVYLFPQKKMPENYILITPLIYDGGSRSDVSTKLDRSKKTIFISMGSTGDWKALSSLNHPCFCRYNVITAGDQQGVLNALHIIRTGFISPAEVLPFTDLVICHGGNGTVYQVLSYGLPLLCKPVHFEQEWNVHALEKKGLAKSLAHVSNTFDLLEIIEEQLSIGNSGLYNKLKQSIQEVAISIEEKMKKLASVICSGKRYGPLEAV